MVIRPSARIGSKRSRSGQSRLMVALLTSTALVAQPAFAQSVLPAGGQVTSGAATIATSGDSMTVRQGSGQAIVNWNNFSIGAGASVNFVQPDANAAILNRVTGSTSTTIAGSLSANGQVYLVNPNGIAITPTGTVKVGGGFVASTLDIDDRDFLNGNLAFHGNGASAGVSNEGVITVGRDGYAALLGGTVRNDGLIAVPIGKVGLGSGEQATLDLSGDGFLQVAAPTRHGAEGDGALVENGGTISAEGGTVVMRAATAREASRQAINLSGVVEAKSVSGRNGAIVIGGGEGGEVKVTGQVKATASSGKGGKVEITGRQVALKGAEVDVSGAAGGGTAKIGGDWQGKGTTQRAATTSVDATSVIRADATQDGSGGTVVVWSDDLTRFNGLIPARGAGNGSGGDAEVSGKAVLDYTGFADLSGPGGFGNLLLDPYNVTISSASGSGMSGFDAGANDSVLNVTTLTTALAGAHVTVTTGAGGSQTGNITVDTAVSWSADTTLTLDAAGGIVFNKNVTATGTNAGLVLTYGTDYSLNNGARITLSGASASLSIGGTAYTLIHDVDDLQAIGSSGNYALGNDIDASATVTWNSSQGFAPITGFTGTFAGLGHFIDSLTSIRPTFVQQGLFGDTNRATLRDVTLSNASISGRYRVGGLVGYAQDTILNNVHVTGSVGGTEEIGGLVGLLVRDAGSPFASYVSNSSSSAAVTASSKWAGGLVGHGVNDLLISDSYATGAVTASREAGGLIGTLSARAVALTNVYASGEITGTSSAGGLIGFVDTGSVALTNAYWDGNSTGKAAAFGTSAGSTISGAGVNVSGAPRTQSTYAGFDFTNSWVMIDGETRPMLRNEQSTVIATGTALQLMSLNLAGSYTLGANLNLTSDFIIDGTGYYGGLWGASGFVPVGDSSSQFTGTFDGQSHTITGLTISRSSTGYIGLFGHTNSAVLSNVSLAGGSIRGNAHVGSLVGYMTNGTVTSVSATTAVSGRSANVGGLIGAVDGGSVSNSSASGTVISSSYQVGGLAGHLINGGSITRSYAAGNVTGSGSSVGGLVGANGLVSTSTAGGTISQSYATGSVTVTGAGGGIGGFIGHNNGTITDSYAIGRVSTGANAASTGGFVGINSVNGTITNAYSTGYVTGNSSVGGFAGSNANTASAIMAAYWNTETSGQSAGIASGSGSATGLTTAQLQSGLPAGFSSSIWGTGANLYPYLSAQYSAAPTAVSGIAYSDAGTTVLAGATVTGVAGGTAIGTTVTGANGYYYILLAPGSSLGSSGVMAYLDNGTVNGAAVSDVIGTNGVQNVSIYGSAVHFITDESSLLATRSNYIDIRSNYVDADDLSFLLRIGFAPLTYGIGYGVYISAAGDYMLNGNITSEGLISIESGGTLGVSGSITLTAYGDIILADAISWNDTSSLTLFIKGAGNIYLGDAVTAQSGTLNVKAIDAATTASAINVGTFHLTDGTWSQVASSLPAFNATNFVLDDGTTFLRTTGGDGSVATPYQIADVYGLQGMGSEGMGSQNFVLAGDIDASGTSNWNSGAGFNPIGHIDHYSGIFDGQGHTMSGLVINRPTTDKVGLFGMLSHAATVRNLTLSGGSVTGQNEVGGLVGYLNDGSSLVNVSSSISVTGSESVGGLAGEAAEASITNAHATGSATGFSYVGGLIGDSKESQVISSSATGRVISTSSTINRAGGLIGRAKDSTISNSYATGSVSGATLVGGLIGAIEDTSIDSVYATGSVNGTSEVGGLVGLSDNSDVTNAYATGAVTGNYFMGGLIGTVAGGAISNVFATGAITVLPDNGVIYTDHGGLFGDTYRQAIVTNAFWNTETTGETSAGSSGATGLTTAQMMDLSNFTAAGWSIDDAGGTSSVWRIYDGYTAPVLRSFLTSLTVTGGSGTKTYDGSATSSATGTLSYSLSGYDTSLVTGTAVHTASSADAGTYNGGNLTLSGLYSGQNGYDITFVSGSLTVNQASLTVTANNATKTYDGVAYAGGNGVGYSGFVNGETASVLGGTLSYGGTSQGAVNAGTYGLTASGLTSGNYAISYAAGTLTVTPANVMLTIAPNAASKTYGQALSLTGYSIAGSLIGSDTIGSVQLASAGSAAGAAAGTYDITASNAVFSSGSASNYAITYQVLTNGLTVNQASLTVTANNATKTYDGAAYAGGNGVGYSGFVNGETVSVLGGTLSYGGTSQGAVNAGTYTIAASGLTSGNYAISYAAGSLTVNQASLTVTANNATKTYDGAAYAGGNGVGYSGFVNGETASVLGGTLSYGGTSQGAVNAGTYTISASGLSSGNYAISYAAGSLTVNKAALTVTANNATKTYDGLGWTGGNGVGYSGFVNGETASVLGGTLSYGGTSQGAVNAGTYTISASGLSSGNYAISYAAGSLTVTPANVMLTIAPNAASKTYGQALSLTGYSIAGSLIGSDTIGSVQLASAGSAAGAAAGTYDISASNAVFSRGSASNYAITYQVLTNGLTVNKAALTVTANNATKTYDGVAYAGGNGVGYSGFVNGETALVLGGTLSYGGTSQGAVNAGTYTISASGLTSGNYAISYAAGSLTVNQASLTVTANNATKTYDGLGYTGGNGVGYSGFVNGETASVLGGTLSYGGTSQGAVNAGTYTISASGLTSGNYAISYAAGSLTVVPAPVPPANPPRDFVPGIPASALVDEIGVPLASLPVWRQAVSQDTGDEITQISDVWLDGAPCFGALVRTPACTSGIGGQ